METLISSMRRLCLILLTTLAVAPVALAAPRDAGDGVLELSAVNGNVTISGQGVLWGQMDKGSLTVTDPVAGDGAVSVSGDDKPSRVLPDGSVQHFGKDLHFRITGGTFKLVFTNGQGIDLTTVGVGKATITGSLTAIDDGDYALDAGKWKPVLIPDPINLKFGVPKPPATTNP